MLNFEDEVAVSPIAGLGMQAVRGFMPASPASAGARQEAAPSAACRRAAPHPRGRQAHHQRRHRRQPAGAVQVQMGVGKVSVRLRQPLDAAGNQHEPRHRHLEGPERSDRGRAPHRHAQSRLFRHRRFARREQHRARHLPPYQRAGVPPVSAAPGVRGGHPYPRLPVHRREPGLGRRRGVQRLSRDSQHSRQGRVPDPVHRHADQSRIQDRDARGRPAAAARA